MKSRRIVAAVTAGLLLAATLVASQPAAAASTAPTPVVQGNKLVDSRTGATFVPHGVNIPGLEYSCVQGWRHLPESGEFAAIASWKVNTVRLPINESCWLGLDGAPTNGSVAQYKSDVKAWVDGAVAAGLAVILDLHWNAPAGYTASGQRAMPDERSADLWSSVATAYASNKSVMFELFNEPYSRSGFTLTWECWKNGGCRAPVENDATAPLSGTTYTVTGMQTLVTAVRTTGATQPLLLGGLNYSNDLSGWLANKPTDPLNQLVAAWHNYPGQGCSTSCWNSTVTTVAASVPIVTTEFGNTAETTSTAANNSGNYLVPFMTWADAHGIGYLPWAWWDVGAAEANGNGSDIYALYSGAGFTPKAPSGTKFYTYLASLSGGGTPPTAPLPLSGSPIGIVDSVTAGLGTITITGWALDPDTTASIPVHVYTDSTLTEIVANGSRPDLAAAYPAYGAAHGFSATYAAGPGQHTVCAYGIEIAAPGSNSLRGCRAVTVPTGSPIGVIDTVTVTPGAISVSGWALDPDTSASIPIHIYTDASLTTTTANLSRTDIAAAYPAYGANHGYATTFAATPGQHTVCVYGIEIAGTGANSSRGCRVVTVPTGSPIGVIDTLTVGPGTIAVSGWALDPDTAASIPVHIYVDSTLIETTANLSRTDIAAAYPGYGANHGYSASFTATPGNHTVCVYGIEIAGSGSNSLRGCRAVSLPTGSPIGVVDSVTASGGMVTVSGWVIDPDTAASTLVHIYTGPTLTETTANLSRPDIAAAYPGYGAAHGFSATYPVTPGQKTICVYGIEIAGTGSNSLRGCRVISVP